MPKKLLKIRRALISVSNKSNILQFAQELSQYNIQLLASEGTAKQLIHKGLQITTISQYTDFPEIMNGRVKTLHTKILAGILARPEIDDDTMKQHSIETINMVIANFYPYSQLLSNKSKNEKNNFQTNDINNINDSLLIESIDIGGPSIVRAAAKNYKNVAVIVNSNDYTTIIDELKINNGKISIQTRLKLANTAFQYVATYDALIANNFNKQLTKKQKHHNNNKKRNISFPDYINCMNINFVKKENMRYGENPHQSSALYIETQNLKQNTIAQFKQLQGKKLSYNNIIDIDTALECIKVFTKPTCIIIKHGIPCGVSSDQNILQAYEKAYQTDPTSAFGGILAFNKNINSKTAQTIINKQFTEIIIAPCIDQDSMSIFNNKKNIRIIKYQPKSQINTKNSLDLDFKRINGGLLIQNKDIEFINIKNLKIVTKRQPTKQEIIDAIFCWKIVKFVKSNAIVYGKNEQTIGIGSGQTSRIFAAEIATLKAKRRYPENKEGTVMASDAFLPFPDTVDTAASIGTTCIIQPGGSIQDKQVIKHAEKNNISMIFTYKRHFRH